MNDKSGVYLIQNITNYVFYVGSSKNITIRMSQHKRELNKNIHINKKLQNSYNKYGINSFNFLILEKCSREKLEEREQYWFDLYSKRYKKTFNIRKIVGNNYGLIYSEESKLKMRNAKLGTKLTEEQKRKIGMRSRGRIKSDEELKKISKAHKGKVLGEETRKKISEAQKGRKKPPFSEEHKRKISEANKGRKLSEEAKRRIKEARKCISEETRKRMSISAKKRPCNRKGVKLDRSTVEKTRNTKYILKTIYLGEY